MKQCILFLWCVVMTACVSEYGGGLSVREELGEGISKKPEPEGPIDSIQESDPTDLAIVRGNAITIEQAPWQISLRSGGSHTCGGTILTESWILTAAHCVNRQSLPNLTVVAGSSYIYQQGGQTRRLEGGWYHPGYRGDFGQGEDIAVLKLARPLVLDGVAAKAATIMTESLNALQAPGKIARATGWGGLWTGSRLPNQLQMVDLPILSREEVRFRTGRWISDEEIPLGNQQGQGVCQGDSGGPLMVTGPGGENLVIGVASWVPGGCGQPGVSSFYTKVSKYVDWLRERMGSDFPQATPQDPNPMTPPPSDPPPNDPPPVDPGPTDPPPMDPPNNPPMDPPPANPNGEQKGTDGRFLRQNTYMDYRGVRVAGGSEYIVQMTGNGDADLYVGFDTPITWADFDCRPYGSGSVEECRLTVPPAGATAYVRVNALLDTQYQIEVTYTPE